MNARTKKILDEVLELPRDERMALVHDVLVSLDPDGEPPDVAQAWGEEIRRRADDVLAGRALGPECRPHVSLLRERLRSGG